MNNTPKVSIVTPSYNQGRFIEDTILSVKNQSYPDIEHIIVDACSTDNTLEILKKYEGTYNMRWISEPDKGQSDAINKGWKMAAGEILAYLNSDDTYMPMAVETAVNFLTAHPEVSMIYGDCSIINEHNEVIGQCPAEEFNLADAVCDRQQAPQPSMFFRKDVLDEIGYLDVNLYMSMDLDLYIRTGLKFKIKYVPKLIANFRIYTGTKSVSEAYKFAQDHLYILDKVFSGTKLPKEIIAVKSHAYGSAHLKIGSYCFQQRQTKQARNHLIKSVISHPQYLMKPSVLYILIMSILGKRAIEWKSKIKRSIFH